MWASFSIFYHRRKYSIEYSRLQAKSRNTILLLWQYITSNMYAFTGIWNLCLNQLYSNSTSAVKWSDFMEFIFQLTQTCVEMLSYVEMYNGLWILHVCRCIYYDSLLLYNMFWYIWQAGEKGLCMLNHTSMWETCACLGIQFWDLGQ